MNENNFHCHKFKIFLLEIFSGILEFSDPWILSGHYYFIVSYTVFQFCFTLVVISSSEGRTILFQAVQHVYIDLWEIKNHPNVCVRGDPY